MDWNPNSIDGSGRASAPQPAPTSNDPQDIMLNMLLRMGAFQSVRTGKPPAAKLAVEEMDLIVFDERDCERYSTAPCAICADHYKVGDEGKKFPCGHVFHTDCIVQWLEKNNSCPMCRYELPTLDEDYEHDKRMKAASQQAGADFSDGEEGGDRYEDKRDRDYGGMFS